MERRNFIASAVSVIALSALPRVSPDALATQPTLNTFTQNDTLIERVNKLNQLTGTRFKIGWRWIDKEWRDLFNRHPEYAVPSDTMDAAGLNCVQVTGDYCGFEDDRKRFKWRVFLVEDGKRWSGDMLPGEMFQWTAQVALGYRMAKKQES